MSLGGIKEISSVVGLGSTSRKRLIILNPPSKRYLIKNKLRDFEIYILLGQICQQALQKCFHMSIRHACALLMQSVFFAAKRSVRGDVYVDGGVLDNYPIKLFDRKKYAEKHFRIPEYYKEHNTKLQRQRRKISPYIYNKETLGFRLDSAKEIAVFRDQAEPKHHEITDFISYAWRLIGTVLGSQDSRHLHSDDWQRTIYIDTLGVGTTEFDLSDSKKKALVESGKTNTKKYFEWYDDVRNKPINRS